MNLIYSLLLSIQELLSRLRCALLGHGKGFFCYGLGERWIECGMCGARRQTISTR